MLVLARPKECGLHYHDEPMILIQNQAAYIREGGGGVEKKMPFFSRELECKTPIIHGETSWWWPVFSFRGHDLSPNLILSAIVLPREDPADRVGFDDRVEGLERRC